MGKDFSQLRKEYTKNSLDTDDVDKDPLRQFVRWFEEARAVGIREPNAMSLATVSTNNFPSCRIVLLKCIEAGQFIFYTNYASAKGEDLRQNAVAALTFFWPELERQVRIQGTVGRVSEEMSIQYFQSRPRESQIGAWVSPQSTPIRNRMILEERKAALEEKYKNDKVLPKPAQWGGYGVTPFMMEFWQGRPSRLHDRIVYIHENNGWTVKRLAP